MCIRVGQNSSFCFFSITEMETLVLCTKAAIACRLCRLLTCFCATTARTEWCPRSACQQLMFCYHSACLTRPEFCLSNKARAVIGKEGVVGQKLTEAFLGQINLIAPPLYVVTAQTMERMEGLELLNKAVDAIKENITTAGGVFQIQEAVSFLLHFLLATCSVATHSPLHKASKKGLPSKKNILTV